MKGKGGKSLIANACVWIELSTNISSNVNKRTNQFIIILLVSSLNQQSQFNILTQWWDHNDHHRDSLMMPETGLILIKKRALTHELQALSYNYPICLLPKTEQMTGLLQQTDQQGKNDTQLNHLDLRWCLKSISRWDRHENNSYRAGNLSHRLSSVGKSWRVTSWSS